MDYVVFSGGVVLFFFALQYFLIREKVLAHSFYALLNLVIGGVTLYFWAYISGTIHRVPLLVGIDLALSFAIGPLT